jgi:hypothetical protein
MSLVDIVAIDDTGSDIHATSAAIDPLVGWRRHGDAMSIITCVTTPHKDLDFTVNYVWHLLEGLPPMRARLNFPAWHPPSPPKLHPRNSPYLGWLALAPPLRRRCPSEKGRSRHRKMTAGTPARREPTDADARHPYEGRSRPPVTPQICMVCQKLIG